MPTALPTALPTAVALALVVSMLLPAPAASAHDRLERVDPVAGTRVDRLPGQVQLIFDQAVGRRFSTVVVTGPDGAAWAAGPTQVLDNTVTQPLRPSGPGGVYSVAYRIVSADGHPVTGKSTFTVTGDPVAAPATVAAPVAGSSRAGVGHRHRTTGLVLGLLLVGLLGAASRAALRRRSTAGETPAEGRS